MERAIPNCGHLRVDNSVDLTRGRLVTNLLKKIAENFAKKSVYFLGKTNYFPFVYSEKALTSVLLPSLADAADAVTTEYPVNRKRGRGSTFGFLDYWVFYHDSLLLVEAKHVWFNTRSKRLTEEMRTNWQEALQQTDRIPMPNIRWDLDSINLDPDKILRVPILIAPFWNRKSIKFERQNLITCHENIRNWMSPRPNWTALWLIKSEHQGPYDWSDETREKFDYYPAVGFYSYIHVRAQ